LFDGSFIFASRFHLRNLDNDRPSFSSTKAKSNVSTKDAAVIAACQKDGSLKKLKTALAHENVLSCFGTTLFCNKHSVYETQCFVRSA